MKLLYPASHERSDLTDAHIALKIARHSPCTACGCSGLYPPLGLNVALDSTGDTSLGNLGQYGSDDEDDEQYLSSCRCNHSVAQHGANPDLLGSEELNRRARVAIRLDEQLQDIGKLHDFDFADDDIISLRKQMVLPTALVSPTSMSLPDMAPSPASSALSDLPPPHKKRRLSGEASSLSDANVDDDDDEDEDEMPLAAARMSVKTMPGKSPSKKTGRGGGKQQAKTHAHTASTAPISLQPPTGLLEAQMNGQTTQARVKVEDKMDEDQLDRLVTGVNVDSSAHASTAPTAKPEKAAFIEIRQGIIQVAPVQNDKSPRSLVILTGLKTLFQKQLPKMPREYIARLVFDSNSKALAIIKRGYKVVGGICYRPFPHRGFAEIVFFATASVDQVKGYGGMLMDYFKQHIRNTYPDMMHFLTYADNYAVGYFEKQGFSKEITLDRARWAGYIKDYEGGTIMQCTMLRNVNYLEKIALVAQQREAILTKIREMSKSHIVYPGLPQFQEGAPPNATVDPRDVPGLRESGWTPAMSTIPVRASPKNPEHGTMERLLHDLKSHSQAWAFLHPVNTDEVTDYLDVIKEPMDFHTMEHKLETRQYDSLETFLADAKLVFDNCRIYNPEGSIYAKNATKLEKHLKDRLATYLKKED